MVEKTILLTGTSTIGIEDAVSLAIRRATLTIKNIRQAKILDTVALVDDQRISKWRVRIEVTFSIEDALHE